MSTAACPNCGGLPRSEYLSVVSKVCSELQARFGVGHKLLGQFITHLGVNSASVPEFDAKLKANGANFPDDLVRALIAIIHAARTPAAPANN